MIEVNSIPDPKNRIRIIGTILFYTLFIIPLLIDNELPYMSLLLTMVSITFYIFKTNKSDITTGFKGVILGCMILFFIMSAHIAFLILLQSNIPENSTDSIPIIIFYLLSTPLVCCLINSCNEKTANN